MARADDYPNELAFTNDERGLRFGIARFLAEPDFFKLMSPLVDELITKTRYHRDKLGKKFYRYFGHSKNIEFRLNVLNPAGPAFSKLKRLSEKKRSGRVPINTPATP
jgi:hypothetical protein